jgi:hypothetical protein
MGRADLVLTKDQIERVEASADGEAPVTIQGMIDRKIFEQLKTPTRKENNMPETATQPEPKPEPPPPTNGD